jgi:uncharacterized membrane protein
MNTWAFAGLTLAVGVVAGLRAVTPLMVVSWAACLGWIDLHNTWAGFLGHAVVAVILTVLAATELITDQLPSTPSRKAPVSFGFRLFSGAFSGAVLAASAPNSTLLGVVCGAIGAILGTLGGYDARMGLVRSLKLPDRAVAIPEDVVAVGGGFLLLSLFPH